MKLRVEFCPGNSSVCSHALVPMHRLYPVGSCSTSPATSSSGRSLHAQHAKGLRRKFPAASSQSVAHTSGPASGSKAVEQSYSGLTNSSEEGLEGVIALLEKVAFDQSRLSPEACASLEEAIPVSSLSAQPPLSLARLMLCIAAAGGTMSQAWQEAAAAATEAHLRGCAPGNTRLLSEVLWAVSEMRLSPSAQWFAAAQQAVACSIQDGSFLGPQFSACICALGSLGLQPEEPWLKQVTKEAEFQLTEFTSDFAPTDIARLAIGLSYLKAEISTSSSSPLMKAVFMKVRTIEDKGLVDWALAKLDSEEKSMVFDPRWNHEELSVLPNREKDKRRILSEGWYRTQWGGYSPGGK